MIGVAVLSLDGTEVGRAELDERVFGIAPHRAVLHQAVLAQLANARKGTHDTKTRGEVAGGGAKPWRQKGTGRARQGSTRAPHWRKGGVVFGPHPRLYTQRVPRKMRRLAMRSALSDKVLTQGLIVVDRFALEAPRTKVAAQALERIGVRGRALLVVGTVDAECKRSVANLPDVRLVGVSGLNLLDVLNARHLVLDVATVDALNRALAADRAVAGATAEGDA